MKKVLLMIMAMSFLIVGMASADIDLNKLLNENNITKEIPALDSGIVYSVIENEFEYSATFELKTWLDEKLSLNGGYYSNDGLLVTLNYDLGDVWLLNPAIGVYFGATRFEDLNIASAEADVGFSLRLLGFKF